MAKELLMGTLTLENSAYRKCKVDGKRAVFHRWCDWWYVVGESPLVGGAPAGQVRTTYGVVEFEDGSIAKVDPILIMFCDDRCKEEWEEKQDEEH